MMPAPGYTHSDAVKAEIGRKSRRMWARRKATGKLSLADMRKAEETNTAVATTRPFLSVARDVFLELLEDQGGADQVSTARRALLDSQARLHFVELVLGLRIAQDPTDLDAMARLTAIVNARRSLLVTLGLDRVAREIEALEFSQERLEAAASAAGRTVDELLGSAFTPTDDRAAERNARSEATSA